VNTPTRFTDSQIRALRLAATPLARISPRRNGNASGRHDPACELRTARALSRPFVACPAQPVSIGPSFGY
jgi:hypothetical protein